MEHPEDEALWDDRWTPPTNIIPEDHHRRRYELFSFQKRAVAFMHRCRREFGFCLLGDDMGVGKVLIHDILC